MLKPCTNLTFLGPRIWEIVPDFIKKSNNFEELKLKIKFWIPENCPCRLCTSFNSYAAYFIIFKSHFFFCQF